jgi:hypothetical protein
LTPSYVVDTAKSIWIRLRPRDPVHHFEADGHLDYVAWDQQIQAGTFPRAEKIQQCAEGQGREYEAYRRFSTQLEKDLEELLTEAARDNVRVVLWITPMHPLTLEKIRSSPQARQDYQEAVARLGGLGAKFHLPIVDLTEIESFHGQPDTWYDCIHYSEADAGRIAEAIFHHGF